jgi:hypothetical protein
MEALAEGRLLQGTDWTVQSAHQSHQWETDKFRRPRVCCARTSTNTESDTESNPESNTESDTESNTESNPESNPESDTESTQTTGICDSVVDSSVFAPIATHGSPGSTMGLLLPSEFEFQFQKTVNNQIFF